MSNQPQPQVQPIITLEHFAELMSDWFTNKSQQVDALVNFPEHEPIRVQDNVNGIEKVLTGAEREAFIDGLKVAATIFDRLPFETRIVDEEGKPAEQATE